MNEPILGLEASIQLDQANGCGCCHTLPQTLNEFLVNNKDIFGGVQKLPATFSIIILKENSKPSLHYKKRVPLSLKDKLETKLNEMVCQGIIESVDYPTDWVNNLQIVEKSNGDLRICL